jgi:hypothetical protein
MTYLNCLPDRIARFIRTRYVCEFATMTKAGVPIDSPLVPFTSENLETIDSATGLAYPAKADRVRRNPRIGMLFEGARGEPVVSISALGEVRDRDFQANLERYLSEQILTPAISPAVVDYPSLTYQAIWYFTRIIMHAKPVIVRWWDDAAALDGPPHEWRAPIGSVHVNSDPAPSGAPSKSPWEPVPSWQDLAQRALGRHAAAHLTLVDSQGFPLPIRARSVRLADDGLELTMPGWLPWRAGKATVSFEGIETLVGQAEVDGPTARFRAERQLPMHPLISEPEQLLRPTDATKKALLDRIDHELSRRGITERPVMPATPPEPTAGARLRAASAVDFQIAS